MAQVKFADIKSQLQDEVQKRLRATPISGENGFALIEGFFTQPIQNVSDNITIGGPAVPMVAVLGNTSGRIYFFALKALLPMLDI